LPGISTSDSGRAAAIAVETEANVKKMMESFIVGIVQGEEMR
jgi:hypothetical protein